MQLFGLLALMLSAAPSDSTEVRVHHVVFAQAVSDVADGGTTPDAFLRRTIFVLGAPTTSAAEGDSQYLVARGAIFTAARGEAVEPPVPMTLVNHAWASCKGLAKQSVVLTPGTGSAVEALELEGCPTEPNRYASWAIEGPLTEVIAIDARPRPAGRGDDPEFQAMNAQLKKSGAKLAPIRPRPATIAPNDPRVRDVVTAAENDHELQAFAPRLFVSTKARSFVLFEKESEQTLALVTLDAGELKRMQTERMPW